MKCEERSVSKRIIFALGVDPTARDAGKGGGSDLVSQSNFASLLDYYAFWFLMPLMIIEGLVCNYSSMVVLFLAEGYLLYA